ncbi:MAG: hypothetical protein GY796_16380 [Chloroflexi bacterium]|nr:hypothetical protein [Chloroflexota bacterium]
MLGRMKRLFKQLGRLLTAVIATIWRFIGRVGLASRNTLTWFVWLPLYYLTLPFWLPLRWLWDVAKVVIPPVWHFVGMVGAACRRLLFLLIWRPFLKFIVTPLVWYYRNLLKPFVLWVIRLVRRGLLQVWRLALLVWGVTAPRRALYSKRVGSRWRLFRARLRVVTKRPTPPTAIEVAPSVPKVRHYRPRTVRLATAVAALALIILVALLSLQGMNGSTAVADASTPVTIILTPTPLPPTPSPVPTVAIKLTPWATPDPTTGGGAIAFAQTVKGNQDIYVLPVGQTEPIQMTTHPAADKDPVWSPDGERIAFTSRRDGNWELYVYDIPQGKLTRLTREMAYDAAPVWSPDGQWLAYESYKGSNLDIYLVKANGREGPFRLTYDPAPDYAPAWSPRGRHLAYTSWRGGNKDIYLQSLDDAVGEEVINLTQSPGIQEDGAAFSPDGRFLAYHQDSAGFPVVYALPLNENNTPSGVPYSIGQRGIQSVWSPDSELLLFVYSQAGQHYLVAGSADAWGIAPQVFVAEGKLGRPSWIAVNLSPEMASRLENVDRAAVVDGLYVEALARQERGKPPTLLFELAVNAPSPYLSDHVDQSFTALRNRTLAEVGWDFLGQLDGMFEAIESEPLPGQTAESWNKAGRAFDIYYREALGFDPRVLVMREELAEGMYWRVFVKTAAQDGSQGQPLTALNWDFQARSGDDPKYYQQGGKLSASVPSGYYVDFTALAADYGWERVPANENWRSYFPDILFWHFENSQGLTWEEAMLQLYSEAELERYADR